MKIELMNQWKKKCLFCVFKSFAKDHRQQFKYENDYIYCLSLFIKWWEIFQKIKSKNSKRYIDWSRRVGYPTRIGYPIRVLTIRIQFLNSKSRVGFKSWNWRVESSSDLETENRPEESSRNRQGFYAGVIQQQDQ